MGERLIAMIKMDKEIKKMSLSRETQLGKITINDNVIAKSILKATAGVANKLYLSTEKGKILGSPLRVGTSELAGNIVIEEIDERYEITFYVIISFGSSIKNVTETVLNTLQEEMQSMFPNQGGVLRIKIVGVKSKNVAERDIEVKREYEASR